MVLRQRRVAFLANNGDMGGGEVMLLSMADAARRGGYDVEVVAPHKPGELADVAQERGFWVTRIPGEGRPSYMRGLRSWARASDALLWCNGLVPATATVGMSRRVVHLHQLPTRAQKSAALAARRRALAVLAPSGAMARKLGGNVTVLPNWSPEVRPSPKPDLAGPRIGYFGRLDPNKGIGVLVEAVRRLQDKLPSARLVVGGEARFVSHRAAQEIDASLAALGDSVERLGWVDRNEFFGQVDVVAVPSIWQEPFGLVVSEAMSARVPVVVSDAGALPEVVGEAYPFIAPAGQAQPLASMLHTCLSEPDVVEQVTARARRRWELRFSPYAGQRRLLDLCDRIVAREAP